MSNSIAPGSSADVNVRVTALTTNPNVPVTYKTIILKKNLVNGVNTLTQEMLTQSNVKYVIKYDFIFDPDVVGGTITVPQGCILEFDGGSLANAQGSSISIIGQNTGIKAELVKIFDTNVIFNGNWNIVESYPEWFGAKGDGTTNDTASIQKAIDFAYSIAKPVYLNSVYRSDSLVLKTDLVGNIKSTIIFNLNQNIRNYESDGSAKYHIKRIYGVIFESDKSSKWNSTDASDSYLSNVTNPNVIRKYGQRVFIGNKTSPLADNNIRSLIEQEALQGIGDFSHDYSQWVQATYINHDKLYLTYESLTDKFTDANVLSCPEGIVIDRCSFIGFTTGLILCGTYGSIIKDSYFYRCKIGLDTHNSSILPGNLSSPGSKTTTLVISKCSFEDISYFAVYGADLQESHIYDCIFERVPVGVALVAGTMNHINDNFFEIVHSATHIVSDNATYNLIDNNFVHQTYGQYYSYMRYGSYNKIQNCRWNGNVYANVNIMNCDFDNSVSISTDDNFYYFYINGNSIERDKTKYAIWKVEGDGTTAKATPLSCSRKYGTFPRITFGEGFGMGESYNHEKVIDVTMTNKIAITSFSNPGTNLNSGWFDVLNYDTGRPALYDLRTNGNVAYIKILFVDGYTA